MNTKSDLDLVLDLVLNVAGNVIFLDLFHRPGKSNCSRETVFLAGPNPNSENSPFPPKRVKYVQSNAADFEIPKLKIRIVHRYVRLLLKMTPKLNDTHFEMVYNLFHSTMEVIIKRIVFVAQSFDLT
mgnify:CR=1 FL=1